MSDYSYIEEQDFDQKVDISIWKKLYAYALRYKKLVILTSITMVFVAFCDILYPLFTKYAIDNFVEKQSAEGIMWFAIAYVAVVAAQGFCVYTFVNFSGKLEMGMSYDIRQDAFIKLQKLSFSYYDKTPVGYIMA